MDSIKILLVSLIISLIGADSCQDKPVKIDNFFYGSWKLFEVSGGFTGRGHDLNFNYFNIEKPDKYSFSKNDTILEYGRITLLDDNTENLIFKFIPDENSNTFMRDSEKLVILVGIDTLNLNSPCCDRYNYHFIKK